MQAEIILDETRKPPAEDRFRFRRGLGVSLMVLRVRQSRFTKSRRVNVPSSLIFPPKTGKPAPSP